MAGAGWKSYSTGDLISATEFQTFVHQVMPQVCNSECWNAALGIRCRRYVS